MSFGYWMDTEGLTGEQIQAGTTAHQWAPEIVRKENTNTGYRYLNLFPEKPRSLFIDCTQRPQSHKDGSGMSCLSVTGWTSQELRAMTGKQIEAGAKAHQYAPENVRKENRITGYRYLNLFPGKPRSLIH